MQITDELIDKLARLSRLSFDADQTAALRTDLAAVLDFFEKISQLDTSQVEPLIHINPPTHAQPRPDEAHTTTTQAQALSNAPLHDDAYFLVPKVIQK